MNNYNKNRGFSLIEVLIALVILSVGMLGVLTLQVKSMQFSQSAQINTNVVNAAADIADRIRVNAVGLDAYIVAFGEADEVGDEPAVQCADTVGGNASGACSIDDIAAYDIWQWKQQLDASRGIPGGQGAIAYSPPDLAVNRSASTYTIDIRWNERGESLTYQLIINN